MRNEWDEGRSGNGQGRELTIRDASYLCPSLPVVSLHLSSLYTYVPLRKELEATWRNGKGNDMEAAERMVSGS